MKFPEVALRLPDWVESFLPEPDVTYLTVKARMRLVIGLAQSNLDHGTGGHSGRRSSTCARTGSWRPA